MAGTQVANNHAGREQGKPDNREEENQVSQVQHSLLEILKMGIDAETGDGLDQPIRRPTGKQIDHGRESRQQEQQANDDQKDTADHFISGHGRGEAANSQVSASQQKTSHITAENYSIIGVAEVSDR